MRELSQKTHQSISITLRRVFSPFSGRTLAPAQLGEHVLNHPVMLFHLSIIPSAIRGTQIAVLTNLTAQAGEHELFRRVH
jgi:hypothetical protein